MSNGFLALARAETGLKPDCVEGFPEPLDRAGAIAGAVATRCVPRR